MKWNCTEMEVDDQDGVAVKQLAALLRWKFAAMELSPFMEMEVVMK